MIRVRGNSQMRKLKARFKLWLDSKGAKYSFGDGKWRLLETIEAKGSLSAASEELRISYRKAWGDLKKAEKCLGVTLVEKSRGGRAGGHSSLTEKGEEWIRAYESFHSDIEKAIEKAYEKHIKGLSK